MRKTKDENQFYSVEMFVISFANDHVNWLRNFFSASDDLGRVKRQGGRQGVSEKIQKIFLKAKKLEFQSTKSENVHV